MEFDELLITTGVDALVRLVKEKQRIELPAASKLLNIPESTLEEWTRILEEEKLLKIEYKLTKVYLVWLPPAEEEVARERTSFYESRKDLQGEVEDMRSRLKPRMDELVQMREALAKTYEKLAPRLDALEKATANLPFPSAVLAKGSAEPVSLLKSLRGELQQMRDGLDTLRADWKELESGMGKPPVSSRARAAGRKPDLEGYRKSLADLEKKLQLVKKGIPGDLPLSRDLDRKIRELQQEFRDIRSRESRIREELQAAGVAHDTAPDVIGQLSRHESGLQGMRSELKELEGQAKALVVRMERFLQQAREEKEAVERLGDSLSGTKDALSRYPAQAKILQELEAMGEREKVIGQKMDAVEKLLSMLGSPQQLLEQFDELQSGIQAERAALEEGSRSFANSMAEQKSLYDTFEKIRERTSRAIVEYTSRMMALDAQLRTLESAGAKGEEKLLSQQQEWARRMKDPQFQEMVRTLEDVRVRQKLLEQIKGNIETSFAEAENLNRRLSLLAQQAKLIELRSEVSGGTKPGTGDRLPGATSSAGEALRNQLTLTAQEEAEFRRKRAELRDLIQKLWEQS